MLVLADTRMALLSLKYASVTEIHLLGMQMILCSSCCKNLAQFLVFVGYDQRDTLPDMGHNGPVLAVRKVIQYTYRCL